MSQKEGSWKNRFINGYLDEYVKIFCCVLETPKKEHFQGQMPKEKYIFQFRNNCAWRSWE
jgi:hypothetical protein